MKSNTTPQTVELDPTTEYRVLSIRQPWAWAVFHAGKDVENRTWDTSYRGPLLIHAPSHRDPPSTLRANREQLATRSGLPLASIPSEFPTSVLLGMVDLTDCVERARSRWTDPGHRHWLFANPRLLAEPVKGVGGTQKLWRWQAEGAQHPRTSPTPVVAETSPEPEAKRSIDEVDPARVLAAFREVVSATPANDVDVYRAVSRKLGFARMGARVEAGLRGHARTAVRKGVLVPEGKLLRAGG